MDDQDIKEMPQRSNNTKNHESRAHTQATIDDNNKGTYMKTLYATSNLDMLQGIFPYPER